jgi:phosphopantothenate-cysteine ligase
MVVPPSSFSPDTPSTTRTSTNSSLPNTISTTMASTTATTNTKNVQEVIESFVWFHYHQHSRPIALVTSGGTAVDIEENTVRTIENFSTGRRGAISVEQFLKRGYAVIHLWRTGSVSPFARVFQDFVHHQQQQQHHQMEYTSTPCDFLSVDGLDRWIIQSTKVSSSSYDIHNDKTIKQGHQQQKHSTLDHYIDSERILTLSPRLTSDFHVRTALQEREYALQRHLLLTLPFRTVDQYLELLHLSSSLLKPCGRMACIYLAAAVSDFTITNKSVHKLQSSSTSEDGTLTLHLQPVPKCIPTLRKEWAPQAFVTSFKLETQQELLEPMARRAIDKYNVHLVCANLLHTRNEWVWMIPSSSILFTDNKKTMNNTQLSSQHTKVDVLSIKQQHHKDSYYKHTGGELEEQIVLYVTEKHFDYISMGGLEESGMADKSTDYYWISLEQTFRERQRQMKRQLWLDRAKEYTLQLCGSAVGLLLSYWLSTLIYQRNTAFSHPKRLSFS